MTPTVRIVVLAGALIVAILLAAMVLMMARRRLFRRGDVADSVGIPLHELRAMHLRGEIDDAEFEQLRNAALSEWGVKPDGNIPQANAAKTTPPTPENPSNGATGR